MVHLRLTCIDGRRRTLPAASLVKAMATIMAIIQEAMIMATDFPMAVRDSRYHLLPLAMAHVVVSSMGKLSHLRDHFLCSVETITIEQATYQTLLWTGTLKIMRSSSAIFSRRLTMQMACRSVRTRLLSQAMLCLAECLQDVHLAKRKQWGLRIYQMQNRHGTG